MKKPRKRTHRTLRQHPGGLTRDEILGQDHLLDALLTSIFGEKEDADASFPLTVVIDGVTVSGIAISAREWRERLRASLGNDTPLAVSFEAYAANSYAQKDELNRQREEQNLPIPAVQYIHMRDAKVGNGLGAANAPLWRGDLKKLSGWTLGSSNKPEDLNGSGQ